MNNFTGKRDQVEMVKYTMDIDIFAGLVIIRLPWREEKLEVGLMKKNVKGQELSIEYKAK